MKIISSLRTATILIATAAALQFIPIAQAQPNPNNPERPRQPYGEGQMNERRPQDGQPGGTLGGQQRFQPGNPGGPGMNLIERILTDDQRDSMRQAFEANREKNRATMEKIRDAHKALNQAALAEEFKEDIVRAKALEVAKLEAELTVTRLKALSEVQPALSAEQVEKILNPPQFQPQQGGNPANQNPVPNSRRLNRPHPGPDGEQNPPQQPKRDPQ